MRVPDKIDDTIRLAKIALYSSKRLMEWGLRSSNWSKPQMANVMATPHLVGRWSRTLLSGAHPVFDAGKRHNLALALPAFHGLELHPDRTFSFWKTLGRVTAGNGYRAGMSLSGGCLVPAVGGGICLVTNLLFEAAARLGWEIVERHGHTMEATPDRSEPWGLDATVFWPYVDLRFRSHTLSRLAFLLTDTELILSIFSADPIVVRTEFHTVFDHTETTESGQIRCNRVHRRRIGKDGQLLGEETVAVNRKKLVPTPSLTRNCMTCDEHQCGARQRHLKTLGPQ